MDKKEKKIRKKSRATLEDPESLASPSTDTPSKRSKNVAKSSKKKPKRTKSSDRIEEAATTNAKPNGQEQEKIPRPPSRMRMRTVAVALPGSILDNAQTPELRTYLAGQVARAMAIFNVDEVIVFDDGTVPVASSSRRQASTCNLMARILQYLETPQYLRKSFFPKHPDLQYAGLLNPLDAPHHVRANDCVSFREGIVINHPTKPHKGSYVDCGLQKEVQIDRKLEPGTRVTVRMGEEKKRAYVGKAVSPHTPKTEGGLYWGYSVRVADSLGRVFSECPHVDGYDVTIGTSERGSDVNLLTSLDDSTCHVLIVFGGVKGIEAALENDESLRVSDARHLFDYWVNTCPNQGSRTIRTEEALLVSLAAFRRFLDRDVSLNA